MEGEVHTYEKDINPLPSFEGEPTWISFEADDIDTFTDKVWTSLNEDNKVSLFVRFIDIATGEYETRAGRNVLKARRAKGRKKLTA